ncbi:replication protein A 32 kDa subunit isoform X2 [Parasteatoda tepidariorum]|uniref:replication protein A 32 kDa subunit isoform X2 n=1 Tax=Parasteatoda tepidariorum TaxID=114398 RepID=UPI0039BCFCFE
MWNAMDDGGGFGKSRFDQSAGGGFLNTSVAASPSGTEKKKVILVGLVQSVDVQATKVTYVIDDCTGSPIEVQMWIGESDELNKKVNIIHENAYARVTGAIRSMKGKRHILAFNIQPVNDFNEITMHIAEIIHTSMAIAVMDKQSSGGFNASTMMNPGMTASSTDTFASNDSRKLTKPQQLVKQAITNSKNEEGISVMDLYSTLKSLNRQSIQEALDFLCNEGHIYSTIDEDHYKSTDSV